MKPVNVMLEIGQVTEIAEVRDTAAVIQTESGTLSTSLPSTALSKPIVTMSRGAILGEMMVWMPGSASGDKTYGYMGQRPEMMQANIEGLQYYFISSSVNFVGIQDISTITSNAPAEFARPVTLNATLKERNEQVSQQLHSSLCQSLLNATKSPFTPGAARPLHQLLQTVLRCCRADPKEQDLLLFQLGTPQLFQSGSACPAGLSSDQGDARRRLL